MRKLVRFIFRITGWKIDEKAPEGLKKCVVAMGPHTSNWDFIIGKLAFMSFGVNGQFLIKKELFFFPLGWILKKMGGIPVDRKGKNNLTETAVQLFKQRDTLFLVFTPEGTRSYNANWKKGFYYIAKNAQVPIAIGYIDYEKKIGGFGEIFYPSDNVDADIQRIKDFLKNYKGKHPEKGIDGK